MLNNIKNYKLLIFIVSLGFSLAQGYSISGIVLDSATGQPISNVNVYIDDFSVRSMTDKEGYFILYFNNQKIKTVDLNIRIIGYKHQKLQIDLSKIDIDLGEVYLKNQLIKLESVHIHSHGNNSKQISDISLSGQKLNDNFTGNIATTLFNQSNIGINSFGTITSKPVLRGYSGDRFLLMKDGNETGDLSQSSIDHIIALDMTEVTEIEILRGPKSLIYGSNTIGGVVNTTVSGNPKIRVNNFFKKFLFGGESFNKGLYGNMMFYIPIKNNQINILLSNRNTGNQSSPIGKLENTYSEVFNCKLGFTKYDESNYLNFIIENFNMNYGIPPTVEGHINGVNIEVVKNNFQANFHQDISFYIFNQLDVKYNLIDYGHKEFAVNSLNEVALNKTTNNIKIELQSLNTILGAQLDYKQFSSGGYYLTPNTNELYFSLYGFNETEFNNNLSLLSSLRLNYLSIKPNEYNYNNIEEQVVDRKFNYFSSSIGISKIINKFEFNTWIMNTTRAPRLEELYSDGPHLGTYSYEIGAPNLELEKIYGIESSFLYDFNPFNISLTTFYNYSPYYHQMNQMGECDLSNWDGVGTHPCGGDLNENDDGEEFIEFGSGQGWLYKYKTIGVEALIKGLEFNLNYSYHNFNISYNFSLVRGYDLTNELPLSYINPDKQILVLEYKKESMNYKFRFSNIHSQNRIGEFESYTPSSFLVDFIIGYNIQNHNVTIQFNNILNEEYYNHLSKIKSIMPEAGRNLIIYYKLFF